MYDDEKKQEVVTKPAGLGFGKFNLDLSKA